MSTVSKNDWIRFYNQGGKLVIGCVEYIANDKEGNGIILTDVGPCNVNAVIELRKSTVIEDTKVEEQ